MGQYDFNQAKVATRELFKSTDQPDAIFVANDHMAIATMDVIREELHLQIPKEIGVIGFDNIPQASWQSYQLTTISQDVNEMVRATVDVLINQIHHKIQPEHIVIPSNFIERNTLRKPTTISG